MTLRHPLAVLGIVGVLAGAVPLAQLLRLQTLELGSLSAQQATLDPALQSVTLQRGLLEHRALAGAVLRGQERMEPQRGIVADEIDRRLIAVDVALTVHGNSHSIAEGAAILQGWNALASQVTRRVISADASDTGHELLVEQVLVVLDLLALTAAAWPGDAPATALSGALYRDLPAVLADASALAAAVLPYAEPAQAAPAMPGARAAARPEAEPGGSSRPGPAMDGSDDGTLSPAERMAEARLARLRSAHERLAAAAQAALDTPAGGGDAARALAATLAHARAQVPAPGQPATAQLQASHAGLPALLATVLHQHLDARRSTLGLQRAATAAAAAALLLMPLLAAAHAWRRRRQGGDDDSPAGAAAWRAGHAEGASEGDPANPGGTPRAQAGALLQRLRDSPGAAEPADTTPQDETDGTRR